jgi:hypothetical protein
MTTGSDEESLEKLEKRIGAVCRKRLRHSDMYANLHVEGAIYSVCCAVCFEIFERDPGTYVMRMRAMEGTGGKMGEG